MKLNRLIFPVTEEAINIYSNLFLLVYYNLLLKDKFYKTKITHLATNFRYSTWKAIYFQGWFKFINGNICIKFE